MLTRAIFLAHSCTQACPHAIMYKSILPPHLHRCAAGPLRRLHRARTRSCCSSRCSNRPNRQPPQAPPGHHTTPRAPAALGGLLLPSSCCSAVQGPAADGPCTMQAPARSCRAPQVHPIGVCIGIEVWVLLLLLWRGGADASCEEELEILRTGVHGRHASCTLQPWGQAHMLQGGSVGCVQWPRTQPALYPRVPVEQRLVPRPRLLLQHAASPHPSLNTHPTHLEQQVVPALLPQHVEEQRLPSSPARR